MDELIQRPVRFLHIDAGHEYHEVIEQLDMFSPYLADAGVIAMDDYQDREFPGIEAATLDFSSRDRPRRFVPFLAGGNKMFLCASWLSGVFQKHLLERPNFVDKCRLTRVRDFNVLVLRSKLPVASSLISQQIDRTMFPQKADAGLALVRPQPFSHRLALGLVSSREWVFCGRGGVRVRKIREVCVPTMFLVRINRLRQFTFGFWLLVAITFTLPQVSAGQSSYQRASDQVGSFEEEPLSMIDAYQLAREIDPDLAISRFAVDGAEVRRDTARAEYFPQVSLFGEWSENKLRYDGGSLDSLPSLQYPGERYGLQLRSPILNMRSFREYERQSSLVAKTENELEIAETELLFDVATAYLTSLLAGETAEQLEAEFTALTRQLDEAQALYDRSLLPRYPAVGDSD